MKNNQDLINQIQLANQKKYDQIKSQNIVNLNQELGFDLIEEKPFLINKINVLEQFTGLIEIGFFNTIDFIKNETNREIGSMSEEFLYSLNKQINKILTTSFETINQTKNNVVITKQLDIDVINFKKEIYQILHQDYKKWVIQKGINFIYDNLKKLFLNKQNQNVTFMKINQQINFFINQLSDKNIYLIRDKVSEIYIKNEFKNNFKEPNLKRNNKDKKSSRFSDFDEENKIFEFNFNDQQVALKILGLDRFATKKEIKNQYRLLVKKYHPDNNKNQNTESEMKKIIKAYELLK